MCPNPTAAKCDSSVLRKKLRNWFINEQNFGASEVYMQSLWCQNPFKNRKVGNCGHFCVPVCILFRSLGFVHFFQSKRYKACCFTTLCWVFLFNWSSFFCWIFWVNPKCVGYSWLRAYFPSFSYIPILVVSSVLCFSCLIFYFLVSEVRWFSMFFFLVFLKWKLG